MIFVPDHFRNISNPGERSNIPLFRIHLPSLEDLRSFAARSRHRMPNYRSPNPEHWQPKTENRRPKTRSSCLKP